MTLSKTHKILISITVLLELFLLILAKDMAYSDGEIFYRFVLYSFPAIVYWLGSWIFDINWPLKPFKNILLSFKKMGAKKTVKVLFSKLGHLFFSMNGKINRKTYFFCMFLITFIASILYQILPTQFFILYFSVVSFVFLYINATLVKKRANDFNDSGTRYVVIVFFVFIASILYELSKDYTFGEKTAEFFLFMKSLVLICSAIAGVILLFRKGVLDLSAKKKIDEEDKKVFFFRNNVLLLLSIFFFFLISFWYYKTNSILKKVINNAVENSVDMSYSWRSPVDVFDYKEEDLLPVSINVLKEKYGEEKIYSFIFYEATVVYIPQICRGFDIDLGYYKKKYKEQNMDKYFDFREDMDKKDLSFLDFLMADHGKEISARILKEVSSINRVKDGCYELIDILK